MVPGGGIKLFTEDGIRAAIEGETTIAAGIKPSSPTVRPIPPTEASQIQGFPGPFMSITLPVGQGGKRQYPPWMTPHLRLEVMKFERYREAVAFLRGVHQARTEKRCQPARKASLTLTKPSSMCGKKRRREAGHRPGGRDGAGAGTGLF